MSSIAFPSQRWSLSPFPDRSVHFASAAGALLACRSGTPRVRGAARQLQQWNRTLDQLHARKDATAQALFLTPRDLFSLPVDIVFHDLTSTYFEGEGPPDSAPAVTVATASRVTGKCWSGWSWSTA